MSGGFPCATRVYCDAEELPQTADLRLASGHLGEVDAREVLGRPAGGRASRATGRRSRSRPPPGFEGRPGAGGCSTSSSTPVVIGQTSWQSVIDGARITHLPRQERSENGSPVSETRCIAGTIRGRGSRGARRERRRNGGVLARGLIRVADRREHRHGGQQRRHSGSRDRQHTAQIDQLQRALRLRPARWSETRYWEPCRS